MATIRKRGDKYQVQVRRQGQQGTSRTFHKLKDAQAWARQTEAQADREGLPSNTAALKQTTLAELVKRYRNEITVKKKGRRDETIVLNAFLRHPLCQKTLSEVTAADFATYRNERLKDVSPVTLKRQLNPIRHMFELARDEWGMPFRENPLDKVRLNTVDKRRERRLKGGELQLILDAAKTRRNPYIIPIILFALETAMRRGEILQLTWDDVDFKRSCVTIREAKNGYSRVISLTPNALNILYNTLKCVSNVIVVEYEKELPKFLPRMLNQDFSRSWVPQVDQVHSVYSPDHSCVFPITANAFRLAWERTKGKAGIENLHFHDLRHEAISRFFELGLTVPEVASISGHRDPRMLLRYAHAQTKVVQQKLNSST